MHRKSETCAAKYIYPNSPFSLPPNTCRALQKPYLYPFIKTPTRLFLALSLHNGRLSRHTSHGTNTSHSQHPSNVTFPHDPTLASALPSLHMHPNFKDMSLPLEASSELNRTRARSTGHQTLKDNVRFLCLRQAMISVSKCFSILYRLL